MNEPDSASLQAQLRDLEARIQELDSRNLELEREVVRRGVKLSCANVALARAKIAFDEISQQREEAVQDIAHDLKTPLTSIRGSAQNVLDGIAGPVNESVREYLEIIRDQSERLVGAVNWLVQAIRVENEVRTLELETGDLGALVQQVVQSLGPLANQRGIELSVDAPEVTAQFDRQKIRQVVENLIQNAVKFTRAGGQVNVSVVEGSTEVTVSVRDTGIGMNEEQRKNLFRRYYRATQTEGSGLGLLIVRQLVRLHRGEFTIESELGKGSIFSFRLPKRRV